MQDQFLSFISSGVRDTRAQSRIETTISIYVAGQILDA